LLDWLVPVNVLARVLTIWPRILIGALLVVAGVALVTLAHRSFKEVGTNVKPWKPTLHLATNGVYTRLRNPMYVCLMLVVGGIAIAHPSDWTLALLVPMAFVLHFGVVLREERYLEAKFGEDYRRYKESVPRWGLW
jgi:protein-S-isoprenylcysteine O-methyltransferase Ste14